MSEIDIARDRSKKRAVGAIIALVVVLAVAGTLALTLQHSNYHALCQTMRQTLGADAARLNAAVAQSAQANTSSPTIAELSVVHAIQGDITRALHDGPPVGLENYLYDYQARLNLAVSVLQLTNAEDRFRSFASITIKPACPRLIASLSK
ncbi:MAG TPA: hypothetical protein VMU98_07530 [Acidimicrobiales bacterium]|nr:hypothetical protein [Acidimicrobiales bacterium]